MRGLIAIPVLLAMLAVPSNARERRHHVDAAPPEVPKTAPTDACRKGPWLDATPDIVQQAAKLLEQYGAAKSQLAALDASGSDSVVVYRTDAKNAYLVKEKPAYQGNWSEVRGALQDMLNRRMASLACKLQALGVTVSEQKIGAL